MELYVCPIAGDPLITQRIVIINRIGNVVTVQRFVLHFSARLPLALFGHIGRPFGRFAMQIVHNSIVVLSFAFESLYFHAFAACHRAFGPRFGCPVDARLLVARFPVRRAFVLVAGHVVVDAAAYSAVRGHISVAAATRHGTLEEKPV